MESIDILTGQHITITYTPASVGQRIAASLIDLLFEILYGLSVVFGYDKIFLKEDPGYYLILVLLLLPLFTYDLLCEIFFHGQSLGKMFMKIRVMKIDGSTPSIGSYFLRWLIRPADLVFGGGLGLLFIVTSKNSQRLGDMAAGTTVIKVKTEEAEINPEFYDFSNNFKPTYPQAEKLSPGQVELIMNILELPLPEDTYEEDESIHRLSDKVINLLGISHREDDREFLKTIVKDYNYYASLGF